jgi:hypothetical protein
VKHGFGVIESDRKATGLAAMGAYLGAAACENVDRLDRPDRFDILLANINGL